MLREMAVARAVQTTTLQPRACRSQPSPHATILLYNIPRKTKSLLIPSEPLCSAANGLVRSSTFEPTLAVTTRLCCGPLATSLPSIAMVECVESDIGLGMLQAAAVAGGSEPIGQICMQQFGVLDQWGAEVAELIARHHAPRAACGYMSLAVAHEVARLLPAPIVEVDAVRACVDRLREPSALLEAVSACMACIRTARLDWVAKHSGDFPSDAKRKEYEEAWVANYEISDVLQGKLRPKHLAPPGREDAALHFARLVERGEVEHEELVRVSEEEPFRELNVFFESATRLADEPAPADASGAGGEETKDYSGASGSGAHLRAPSEWLAKFGPLNKTETGSGHVFVVDAGGHFIVAKPAWLRLSHCDAGADEKSDGAERLVPVLLVFNSSKGAYLETASTRAICHMCFDGEDERSTRAQARAAFRYGT